MTALNPRARSDSHPKVVAVATPKPERRPAKSSGYEKVADRVGLIPNLRWSDNAFQAIFVAITVLVCAAGSYLLGNGLRAAEAVAAGAAVGLMLGGLLSGFILMVRGLARP